MHADSCYFLCFFVAQEATLPLHPTEGGPQVINVDATVHVVELEKSDQGLGFSILDYQVE